jgi:hypothetical protein
MALAISPPLATQSNQKRRLNAAVFVREVVWWKTLVLLVLIAHICNVVFGICKNIALCIGTMLERSLLCTRIYSKLS